MKRAAGPREAHIRPGGGTTTAATKSTTSKKNKEEDEAQEHLVAMEYDVLYYKSTRKVHKGRGVSKSDGVLSIDKSTGRIVLYGEGDATNNQANNNSKHQKVVLYSGLNSALHRRCHDLEADENLRVGGYEVDVVGAKDEANNSKTTTSVTGTTAMTMTTKKAPTTLSSKSVVATGLRRPMILPAKRPLGLISLHPNHRPGGMSSASRLGPALEPSNTASTGAGLPSPSLGSRTAAATAPAAAAPPPPALPVLPKRTVLRQTLQSKTTSAARAANKLGASTPSSMSASSVRPVPGLTRPPLPSSQGTRRVLHRTSSIAAASTPTFSYSAAAGGGASTSPAARSETADNNPNGSSTDDFESADDVLQRMPVKVATVLRPHQVVAVRFLWNALHKAGGGAILADEPGLGKTLTTIACISALHRANRTKHFCVVCPSSLVNNWVKEFDHWLGKQGQPKRVPLLKGDTTFNSSSMKSFLHSKVGQVVIMSYDLFRLHSHHFAPPATTSQQQQQPNQQHVHGPPDRFALLVVDEGHRLKSTSGSQTLSSLELLPADARLLLSATPIQNNLGELFTLANFCRPGILGDDLAEFRRRFERPIASSTGNGCRGAQRELEQLLSTFMLRRLQSDVLKSMLPPRMEALIFCRPLQRQCELYQDIVAAATSQSTSVDVLSALTSLRKVCSHPFLHDGTVTAEQANGPQGGNAVQLSGKLVVLQGLLESMRTSSDKVVLVSNFTTTLSLVESLLLKPAGDGYVRLDGSTSPESRQSLVETFNKQTKMFCFLLSSKAGGCGLNLVGANRLILLDPSWNPADDIQAMGRIYRQGQQRPTSIYRLFTSGTIEEVIYQRQTSKNTLSGGVLDKKEGQAFTRDEINECMTLKAGCDCATRLKATGNRWPPYRGPTSLLEQGVADVPLTHVAKSLGEAVGFVRIAPEVGSDESFFAAEAALEGSGSAHMSMDLYDSDLEEESEFDLDQNDRKAASSDHEDGDSPSDSETEFQ